jgi:hypothetical protein
MKTAFGRQFGIYFFILLCSFLPAMASVGVGVGTGKIQVDEKLKGGMMYKLPPITVMNTGDVPADYSLNVTYYETQPQLKPARDWFVFTPEKVFLGPGESKNIGIQLNLPLKVVPGDYFAFLEEYITK